MLPGESYCLEEKNKWEVIIQKEGLSSIKKSLTAKQKLANIFITG